MNKTFVVNVTDEMLGRAFKTSIDSAKVSAIEMLPLDKGGKPSG